MLTAVAVFPHGFVTHTTEPERSAGRSATACGPKGVEPNGPASVGGVGVRVVQVVVQLFQAGDGTREALDVGM